MEQCSSYGELIKILLDLRCMALVLERIVREDLTKWATIRGTCKTACYIDGKISLNIYYYENVCTLALYK